MLEWIARAWRRRRVSPDWIIVLRQDGFDAYSGDLCAWSLLWDDVDRIECYTKDLITYDLIIMQFISYTRNQVFSVHELDSGFWEMVKRVKEVFPTSRQDWEDEFRDPDIVGSLVVIYERPSIPDNGAGARPVV